MDYVTSMQGSALGARLRRLSAMIDADAGRVYGAQGVKFEQRWFGVINQLAMNGPMSVGELAEALGVSHPSVSETRQSLERAGLVEAIADPQDARRRILALSATGDALVRRLQPMWKRFDVVARELDQEAGGVVEALARLERALERKSLHARLMEDLQRMGMTPKSLNF